MRFLILALALLAFPVAAQTAWDDISLHLFGGRTLTPAGDSVRLDMPYRTDNDARTRIRARIAPPKGRLIDKVTVVLDENPMPVSAVFAFTQPQKRFVFDATMRVNRATPVHVAVETTDGGVYVAEGFVKTSGQGACAAPPGTDPVKALETLGEMEIRLVREAALDALLMGGGQSRVMGVDISHPSHSGMQKDQVSLLFIPMRYVETLQIDLDGDGFVTVTGGISLSENPELRLSIPDSAQAADVTMTDTDGTVTHAHQELPAY